MLAERLTAQLLAGPAAADPCAVAERLLAIQAQDPRGARLAVRARTAGGSAADVDRAIAEGSAASGHDLRIIERHGLPPDFPVSPGFPEGNYLKFELAVKA